MPTTDEKIEQIERDLAEKLGRIQQEQDQRIIAIHARASKRLSRGVLGLLLGWSAFVVLAAVLLRAFGGTD